jgi:cellulose synthase/poly-beta-1,6-N-acetylglucosamine synthase-like glycosyltransferase
MIAWLFWCSLLLVGYTYAGYFVLIALLARLRGSAPQLADATPAVTVVIAAYNEAKQIGARLRDVFAQDYPADKLRVILASDGSTDDTVREAAVDARVQVLSLPDNRGKAAALNAALAQVHTDIVLFGDARQRFAPGAIRRLVAPFADARVGAVTGELVLLESGATQPARIGLYWRMEKFLREGEARLGWLHGVSGAVYALRRELFVPLPPGTILDDMWMPLQVAAAHQRVWMARDAIAYDTISKDDAEEFRRKLRTLAGNWQLIARLPQLLNPLRNPVWFAWFSHKFLRLIAPWALIAMWISSALIPGTFYRAMFVLQTLGYLGAAFAIAAPRAAARVPLLPVAGTFVMLNLAALLALPACVALDPRGLWKKH